MENRLDCVRFLVEEPELFDLCFVVISRCYGCARVDVCCLMYMTLCLYCIPFVPVDFWFCGFGSLFLLWLCVPRFVDADCV